VLGLCYVYVFLFLLLLLISQRAKFVLPLFFYLLFFVFDAIIFFQNIV